MSDTLGRGRGRLAVAIGLSRVRSFVRNTKGGIAITFALISSVLVMVLGATIDYARLSNAKTEYQIACDRAILAAMRELQVTQQTGGTVDLAALPPIASRSFESNLRTLNKSHGVTFSSTYTEDDAHTSVTGTGTFTAPVPLGIGAIVGGTSVNVGGECVIVVGAAPRVDFHFLVDTSMSMGLAATVADRNIMLAGTAADVRISDQDRRLNRIPGAIAKGCQFACHEARTNYDGSRPPNQISTLTWARTNGIRLRIDVERDGIKAFIDHAEGNKSGGSDYRYSLSTFNYVYSNVRDPSNGNTIKAYADLLALGYPNDMVNGGVSTEPERLTVFPTFASDLKDYMGSPTALGYKQVVILVTDGVRSEPGVTFADGFIHEFTPAICESLRESGATVAVLYTKYLDDTGDPIFDADVKPFYPIIESSLRNNCATDPNFFVAADTPDEIVDGFKHLFEITSNALALSR